MTPNFLWPEKDERNGELYIFFHTPEKKPRAKTLKTWPPKSCIELNNINVREPHDKWHI